MTVLQLSPHKSLKLMLVKLKQTLSVFSLEKKVCENINMIIYRGIMTWTRVDCEENGTFKSVFFDCSKIEFINVANFSDLNPLS